MPGYQANQLQWSWCYHYHYLTGCVRRELVWRTAQKVSWFCSVLVCMHYSIYNSHPLDFMFIIRVCILYFATHRRQKMHRLVLCTNQLWGICWMCHISSASLLHTCPSSSERIQKITKLLIKLPSLLDIHTFFFFFLEFRISLSLFFLERTISFARAAASGV